MAVIENDVLMKFKDSNGDINLLYPITQKDNVDGIDEAIRNQGVVTEGTGAVYTATVEGIASLSAGVSFVMIPHVASTTSSPKLNINGFGEKFIRRRVSGSTSTTYSAKTSADWLSAGKPITVTYDGTQWISDMYVPYAGDFMGTLGISNGGTGATTATQARINLGIETTDGTVSSGNADYAEVGEWIDGNPDAEDRIGYFVCIDNTTPGTTMRKATSSDDVRGVTVASPAFAGGCSSDKYSNTESSDSEADPDADSRSALLPQYDYVAVMGIVPVIDDGTCIVNGRCMPNENGIATLVSGDYGYHVISRIDDTHVMVAVEPGIDFQYKFKNYVDTSLSATNTELSTLTNHVDTSISSTNTELNTLKDYVDSTLGNVSNYSYPVGSIYLSVTDTSPASLFGGTWEQLKDRFLLGAGDSYTAGTTGGEAEHTLTVNEMPSHSHAEYLHFLSGGDNSRYAYNSYYNYSGGTAYSGITGGTGGGEAHNNMPPYLAVYMWKRVA